VAGRELTQRVFTLAALLALMWVVRSYEAAAGSGPGATAMALGFLLLAAFLGGQVASRAGLSRITGYLLVGLLVGPGALHLLRPEDVERLRLLDDIAIALIALTAGGELRLSDLRGMGRTLASISVLGTAILFASVAGAVLLLSAWLPFTAGRPLALVVTVAFVFGSIAIASSPSVAIAVITDTRSRGPLTSTVLGVTVVKDVLVIVAFAAALSVAYALLEPAGAAAGRGLGAGLAAEIGGSLLVGGLLGVGIAAYLRWVGRQMVLFTLGIAWLAAELAMALHLELLLLGLTAGFTLENLLPVAGARFVESLEDASLPLYALFFSLAGAAVHLDELARLWTWVLLLIAVRAAGLWAGTRVGARVGRAPEAVTRWAWLGFISQAGVALGMVTILARSFPDWGEELRTLFVAMVAVHELVGPVALQWVLQKSGEAGRAGEDLQEEVA
jgi:Kef-type K+ transport system membrane component KefB